MSSVWRPSNSPRRLCKRLRLWSPIERRRVFVELVWRFAEVFSGDSLRLVGHRADTVELATLNCNEIYFRLSRKIELYLLIIFSRNNLLSQNCPTLTLSHGPDSAFVIRSERFQMQTCTRKICIISPHHYDDSWICAEPVGCRRSADSVDSTLTGRPGR